MERLRDDIIRYVYAMKDKYNVGSVSLTRLCYRMQKHIKWVGVAAETLSDIGYLDKLKDEMGQVTYSISDLGVKYVENSGLVNLRNWME
jgi:hypothetical protein